MGNRPLASWLVACVPRQTCNHELLSVGAFRSSRLTFTNPDKDDVGRYSVVVTDTDGVSGSHTLTEDGGSHRDT